MNKSYKNIVGIIRAILPVFVMGILGLVVAFWSINPLLNVSPFRVFGQENTLPEDLRNPPPGWQPANIADLVVVSFALTDDKGQEKTEFRPDEKIYPKVTIKNQGGKDLTSVKQSVMTQFFSNAPSEPKRYSRSDVNVSIEEPLYKAGETRTHAASSDNAAVFKKQKYWTMSQKGTHTARVIINSTYEGVESKYIDGGNQKTIEYTVSGKSVLTPTPTKKPTPTPTKKPTPTPRSPRVSTSNLDAAPNTSTCGGRYSLNNPRRQNFGDPKCNFNKDDFYRLLKEFDPAYADAWFYKVVPCESPGYDANLWFRCHSNGVCTPDPGGAWGLFQMGQGRNGQYDHGDVNWPKQTYNATMYRKRIFGMGYRMGDYWECAQRHGL